MQFSCIDFITVVHIPDSSLNRSTVAVSCEFFLCCPQLHIYGHLEWQLQRPGMSLDDILPTRLSLYYTARRSARFFHCFGLQLHKLNYSQRPKQVETAPLPSPHTAPTDFFKNRIFNRIIELINRNAQILSFQSKFVRTQIQFVSIFHV